MPPWQNRHQLPWLNIFVIFVILGFIYVIIMVMYLISSSVRKSKRIFREHVDSNRIIDTKTGHVYEVTHHRRSSQDLANPNGSMEDIEDETIITEISPVDKIPDAEKEKISDNVHASTTLAEDEDGNIVDVEDYKQERLEYFAATKTTDPSDSNSATKLFSPYGKSALVPLNQQGVHRSQAGCQSPYAEATRGICSKERSQPSKPIQSLLNKKPGKVSGYDKVRVTGYH